tara:strand:+ start:2871 stop:4202 length:1332 start_codon:yes stop_codon:yes gene_type:complete
MNYDLFVIGGGSGGVRAARYASGKGYKVGLAEGNELGGTCVNRGCIPKKLYSYASHFSSEQKIMESYGWKIEKKKFSWKKLVNNKRKELKRLNEIYISLLESSGVKIYKQWASFNSNGELVIDNKRIEAEKIIIATGGEPKKLAINGAEHCITSDEAFDLNKMPKSILIVGAGYIAVEFASIFNGLGVSTSICFRGPNILKSFDKEVGLFLHNEMQKKGVNFLSKTLPIRVTKISSGFKVHFKSGKSKIFEQVMFATGRNPMTEGLGLKNLKVDTSINGSIIVDEYFQTSKKNIFAIGDIIDRVQLTPVAINEAMFLVDYLISNKKTKFSYRNIPTAVFSDPNIGSIGLTEEEARKKYKKIDIFRSKFRPLKLSLTKLSENVFIKLIVHSYTDKVIGLHYVGPEAAEIIQGFSVAIVNGLKKRDFDKTIGIHPSTAEEIVTLK